MFDIVYTSLEQGFGWLEFVVNGMNLTEYLFNGKHYCGICRIKSLVEWLKCNKSYLMNDDPFPIKSYGNTGALLWINSDNILDDNTCYMELHEKRQNWIWRHSLDTCKDEFCLPFIVIRYKDEKVEISWDNNCHHFTGVSFDHLEGVAYIDVTVFESVVNRIIGEYSTF